MADRTFISDFKRNFLTGLAALFPIVITLFLLSWLYNQLDRTVGKGVNTVCQKVCLDRPALFRTAFPGAPEEISRDRELRRKYVEENFPGFVGVSIGILAALVFVYLIGFFLRGYLGGRVIGAVDHFFERFPVIKAVYPHARQVADVLLGPRRRAGFRDVVAVQYPRRGVYTVGFRTGEGFKDLENWAGRELVTVFIPTSPTPLTGFVVLAPRDEVMELDMTVEEAFRFCMTAGMIVGDKQRLPAGAPAVEGDRPGAEAPSPLQQVQSDEALRAGGEQEGTRC